jgi:uncharacterized phage-associated protein
MKFKLFVILKKLYYNKHRKLEVYMKILDAAKYIVFLASKDTYSLTPLKLQKLLYFTQGFNYLWEGKPLFTEEFEAWQYGPVNREVYFYFQKYSQCEIPNAEGSNKNGSEKEKEIIKTVWNNYKHFDAFELVDKTHKERPWINAYNSINKTISNSSIKEYFSEFYS